MAMRSLVSRRKRISRMFSSWASGIEQENAFLLVHAGEVEEVGVLVERQGAVGVGGQDVVGVHHGQGVGQQQLLEVLAVAD